MIVPHISDIFSTRLIVPLSGLVNSDKTDAANTFSVKPVHVSERHYSRKGELKNIDVVVYDGDVTKTYRGSKQKGESKHSHRSFKLLRRHVPRSSAGGGPDSMSWKCSFTLSVMNLQTQTTKKKSLYMGVSQHNQTPVNTIGQFNDLYWPSPLIN